MLVGQLVTVVMVGFGLAWIPMMKSISGQLYQYLQSVQAYISPPIAAVFLVGLCWQRVNAAGAMASLATGFVLGLARLVLELNRASLGDGFLGWYSDVNFLHFAILLFVVCSVVLVLVSLATPPPSAEQTAGLTLQTRAKTPERLPALQSDAAWRRTDVRLSFVLAAVVGVIGIVFRG